VALVMTQQARVNGLPLDSAGLLTEGGGQVFGLGKSAVQSILQRHGISRVLASEGGRTSRGSIGNMREYVALLNQLHAEGRADLDAIEAFWIARVHEFFAAKPFRIRLDASRSLRTVVRDVLDQAEDRQKTTPGVYYAGAVMQHMVGAKLDCALGQGRLRTPPRLWSPQLGPNAKLRGLLGHSSSSGLRTTLGACDKVRLLRKRFRDR
jgi:Domain of unknown function (DUF4928)